MKRFIINLNGKIEKFPINSFNGYEKYLEYIRKNNCTEFLKHIWKKTIIEQITIAIPKNLIENFTYYIK